MHLQVARAHVHPPEQVEVKKLGWQEAQVVVDTAQVAQGAVQVAASVQRVRAGNRRGRAVFAVE